MATTVSGGEAKNTRVLVVLVTVAVLMVGITYAAVPIYRIICQVTGYGGTPMTGTASNHIPVLKRTVKVSFNTDRGPDLPWTFEAAQHRVTVRLGEKQTVYFKARNMGDKPITGKAAFNVTPLKVGAYFTNVHCFCFKEQTLAPGEEMEMPLTFYVDPAMDKKETLDDVKEITLSYTFFKAKE